MDNKNTKRGHMNGFDGTTVIRDMRNLTHTELKYILHELRNECVHNCLIHFEANVNGMATHVDLTNGFVWDCYINGKNYWFNKISEVIEQFEKLA